MTNEQKQEQDERSLKSKNEAVLAQAKKEHKGRYPKALAVTTREIKAKQKKDGKVLIQSKLDLFMTNFVKNGGNATQAAMDTFNCKSRAVAASMGAHYLAQGKDLGRVIMEEKGFHYGKMIDTGLEKMKQSKTPEWWDRMMKIGGYEDFMSKGAASPTTVNVMAVQKDLLSEYVTGEYVEEKEE